jgi:hypothetical protein
MPNEPQPQGMCKLQGRQIEAPGLPGLMLPVDIRRWVLANNTFWHLKALYLKGYINGHPVNKMLIDTGAAVNIMPYSVLHRLGCSAEDLIKTNVTLSDFNG